MTKVCAGIGLLFFMMACGPTGTARGAMDGGTIENQDAVVDAPDQHVMDAGFVSTPVCGDGEKHSDELCDDGNLDDDDGCNSICETETNYVCPTPGMLCVKIVVCGNARIEGSETCDDQNVVAGDGCSEQCQLETGWSCPLTGAACVAAMCGDGVKAGFEFCDDGNTDSDDGCDEQCQYEEGFVCSIPGQICIATTCGDGVAEGSEECDDQNSDVGDGCTPGCKREPECSNGVCLAICGDGVLFAPEQCDDGNNLSGDGCDSNCLVEQGFSCQEAPLSEPPTLALPVTVRDFLAGCDVLGDAPRLTDDDVGASPPYAHQDFGCYVGSDATTGMIFEQLGVDGKPIRVANSQTWSNESFDLWYRNNPDYNRTISTDFVLQSMGGGTYQLDTNSMFPMTTGGFDTEICNGAPCEITYEDHHGTGLQNFHFTTETRWWFEYEGDEVLSFSGDDDVWVFINGKLAVDIGGLHPRVNRSIDLGDGAVQTDLGLTQGGIYEAVLFHAERHVTASQYRLTLTNFGKRPSTCVDACGDGIRSSNEVCDQGQQNGLGDGSDYGGCADDCSPESFCGDGIIDTIHGEICDDGLNLGGTVSSCAPGCTSLGARCGDGVVQTEANETCDDGNVLNGDGCDQDCQYELVVD